jgi:hypothetical protein
MHENLHFKIFVSVSLFLFVLLLPLAIFKVAQLLLALEVARWNWKYEACSNLHVNLHTSFNKISYLPSSSHTCMVYWLPNLKIYKYRERNAPCHFINVKVIHLKRVQAPNLILIILLSIVEWHFFNFHNKYKCCKHVTCCCNRKLRFTLQLTWRKLSYELHVCNVCRIFELNQIFIKLFLFTIKHFILRHQFSSDLLRIILCECVWKVLVNFG